MLSLVRYQVDHSKIKFISTRGHVISSTSIYFFFLGTISRNTDNKQVLDKLQVERERGITVKAQTASLFYQYKGETYLLNLIDTPVSLSLKELYLIDHSACQLVCPSFISSIIQSTVSVIWS